MTAQAKNDAVPANERAGAGEHVGGTMAIVSLTLGWLVWPVAFNLGAYGEVFYDDVFRVVVASSILFVITVVNRPYEPRWMWPVAVALASPLLWLLVAAAAVGSTSAALDRPIFVVWLVATLIVSVPLTLRLLADMYLPGLSRATGRRNLGAVVALVCAIGLVAFVVGRENPRFMTCRDFAVAGSAEPANCTP